ncbi:hypothetical protein SAMN03159443_03116 [Pseudomonas sp. NFACC15-1]|uniref:DUF3757 domain-containing protein n=1 Tax=unclassified Pseudomonas TaxID=196821 RepID=UPI0008814B2B|nr:MULTISPECIES: DUF3757 domain-containing protein [unclassified Pseudomonas]SDA79045.1 hypothetical protein SAMN03159443_03116 [Pseudomonas sp. NFACC15-1]SDY43011.1 hypothetical protein SAMN03159380_04070 [Pseudomonas sp. NFACC14]
MRNFITDGGAGICLLIIGHVHAGEITCPAAIQIHGTTETVEIQDDRQWQGQDLEQEANPAVQQLNDAEFALHEADEDELTPRRVTITCNYGENNLTLDYQPTSLPSAVNRCANRDTNTCRWVNTDYFSLRF